MSVLRNVSLALLLAFGSAAHAENVIVRIENFTFNPPEIAIRPGTTVTWENADDIPHSIIEDQTKFRSAVLDTGETFSMTFADASDVGYFCGLHPHMKGKVVVSP
jgi:plastocyanin